MSNSILLTDSAIRLIPLAEVARPHGIRGELRLKVYNRDSDLLLTLDKIVLQHRNGAQDLVKVLHAQPANDAILIHLEGCDDRTHAEALRGARILASREVFPPLEEGEFYVCDLLGARVIAPDGEVGEVEEFLPYPTCDALLVRTPNGYIELPLVNDLIDEIDVLNRVVRVPHRIPQEDG